jgi:quercetin dioxygenase-like cupin family protein
MPGSHPPTDPVLRDLLDVLAENVTPMEPSAGLRARVLASVRAETRYEGFAARTARLFDLSVEAVRELFAKIAGVASEPWYDGGTGTRLMNFTAGPALADAHCGLVHIAPGGAFAYHRHVGEELGVLLQGTLEDSHGSVWHPGDVLSAAAGTEHSLHNRGSEPVIFVAGVYGGIEVDPAVAPDFRD